MKICENRQPLVIFFFELACLSYNIYSLTNQTGTILIARFATTFTTNLQNCYQKCGSFTALADLLLWMAVLLSVLADLLRKFKNFRLTLCLF